MIRFMRHQRNRKAWVIQKEVRLKYAKGKFLAAELVREARRQELLVGVRRLDKVVYHLFKLRSLEQMHRLRLKALVKIQLGVRMLLERRRFTTSRRKAIRIQSWFRSKQARLLFLRQVKAVRTI